MAWLALWKAGVDQALLHGDLLVDIHVSGSTIGEMTRMEDLANRAKIELEAMDFAMIVKKRRGRKAGSPPESIHLDIALEAPAR